MKTTIKRIVSAFLTLILIVGMIPIANASAATQTGILLFNYAGNGNYTTTLNTQLAVKYKPNGTDSSRTAYIKNLGWHHARYNNVAYPDDPLYCIEPYRDFAASMGGNSVDRDVTMDGSGSTSGSNVWYALPEARREAIGLILLYTDTLWDDSVSVTTTAKDDNPNVPLRIATQFLIYEIVCGLRNPETFILNSANESGTSGDIFYNAGVASVPDFASNYNKLVSRVQSAKKLPSFTADSTSSAHTVTLSDKETAVTDSNADLSRYPFVTADEYLSGNVRRKLRMAKALCEAASGVNLENPRKTEKILENIQALEAVQPVDLTASEIGIRIGVNWVPKEIYEQFMYEVFGTSSYR